jgi:hypothetical protein
VRLGCLGASVLVIAACADIGDVTAPSFDVAPSFQVVGSDELCNARLTGGGFDINVDGVKISKGL